MSKGEARRLIEQIREISSDVLEKLRDIDGRLEQIQSLAKEDEPIDKDMMVEKINEIRYSIGALEKEDTQEMEDEIILLNLLKKLDELLDSVLDMQ